MKPPTGTAEAIASAINLQKELLERAIRIKELEASVQRLVRAEQLDQNATIEMCALIVDEEAKADGYPEQLVNLAATIRARKK